MHHEEPVPITVWQGGNPDVLMPNELVSRDAIAKTNLR